MALGDTKMLSETDIHYITGYMYVTSGVTDIRVVLGEKVLDKTSGRKRDVDIVIATAGTLGLAGVEVKDESRRLDISVVEGLCQKLNDMPEITRRGIVSASGYTQPAIKKAHAHGVECLTLVRGRVPPFKTIDLSGPTSFTGVHLEWQEGPNVVFAPNRDFTPDQRAAFSPEASVHLQNGDDITINALKDRAVMHVNSILQVPSASRGPIPVNVDVSFSDMPQLRLGTEIIPLPGARIQGHIVWQVETFPIKDSCYLESSDHSVFAGTVLLPVGNGLLGLAASPISQLLRVFHIPEEVRNIRPTRVQIIPKTTKRPTPIVKPRTEHNSDNKQ